MTEIFISHAVADKALADKFVAFLKEAIGVPAGSIFCSSVDGQSIPLGDDFNEYMKKQIQQPKLVVLLMTPRYMESWFCLMELGATWAQSLRALPIVVPPVKFNVVASTLGLKQGWSIDDDAKLNDLRQMIKGTNIKLEPRTDSDWDKKRAAWRVDLKKLLRTLAAATSVSGATHLQVVAELETLKQELAGLQEAYADASDTIDQLKAAKDPVEVNAIIVKKGGFDPEKRFDELVQAVADLRPNLSIYFYRNLIMDRYGKAAALDWYDSQQKWDAERAIQYKVMDADVPHPYLWSGKRLKGVTAALKDLEEFLQSEEASSFVRQREKDGFNMDTDDLQFWEDNLT